MIIAGFYLAILCLTLAALAKPCLVRCVKCRRVQVGDIKLRHSNIKLLILESATGIVRLQSANKIYFRDNILYLVTLF